MTDDPLDQCLSRKPRMIGRRIAGAYVIVPIAGRGAAVDSIFNLNITGAYLWEALDGRRSGRELVAELVSRFEVGVEQAEADYRAFVQQLSSIEAVESTQVPRSR